MNLRTLLLVLEWSVQPDGLWVATCACGSALSSVEETSRITVEITHLRSQAHARRCRPEIPGCGPVVRRKK